jgi:hypothetical protein
MKGLYCVILGLKHMLWVPDFLTLTHVLFPLGKSQRQVLTFYLGLALPHFHVIWQRSAVWCQPKLFGLWGQQAGPVGGPLMPHKQNPLSNPKRVDAIFIQRNGTIGGPVKSYSQLHKHLAAYRVTWFRGLLSNTTSFFQLIFSAGASQGARIKWNNEIVVIPVWTGKECACYV